MKKIIITGPEASGKSTLASATADYFDTRFVPEFARSFLSELDRPYEEKDLLTIAQGQLELEREYARTSQDLLICDTSMLVMKIWSDYRFGQTHPWILERLQENDQALYLLCRPDIPWEPDPLRENPHDRDQLFELYHRELTTLRNPYVIIEGLAHEKRLKQAVEAIDNF
jgi:NadR type nicotinamide-nucleotide adenylyltransferase